jgi:hypothetical protein
MRTASRREPLAVLGTLPFRNDRQQNSNGPLNSVQDVVTIQEDDPHRLSN